MLVCDECRQFFEEPDLERDIHENGYTEPFACCPYCGCEEIQEAKRCECCDRWEHPEDLTDDFCDDCVFDAVEWYKEKVMHNERS